MKVLFFGRKKVGADCLEWLVKNGFSVVGCLTDSHLSVSPTRDVAQRFNVPLFGQSDLMDRIVSNTLDFDVGVSMVYWRKIKKPIIDASKFGILNFHPAPLPLYRGTAGYNLAILNGLDRWAVSAHYIDEMIDTGPIVDVFEFSIDSEEETAQSLEAKSQDFLFSLFKKTLRLVKVEKRLVTTENGDGTYTTRDDMERMKKLEVFDDWDRKIRAFWFPPYTGAFVEHNGVKYTVVTESILKTLAPKNTSSLFD